MWTARYNLAWTCKVSRKSGAISGSRAEYSVWMASNFGVPTAANRFFSNSLSFEDGSDTKHHSHNLLELNGIS